MNDEVGLWRQIGAWLWTTMLPVLTWLGIRVVNSVSREELQRYMDTTATEITSARREFRAEIRQLFDEAKEDRRRADERFERMQASIHEIHVKLLERKDA